MQSTTTQQQKMNWSKKITSHSVRNNCCVHQEKLPRKNKCCITLSFKCNPRHRVVCRIGNSFPRKTARAQQASRLTFYSTEFNLVERGYDCMPLFNDSDPVWLKGWFFTDAKKTRTILSPSDLTFFDKLDHETEKRATLELTTRGVHSSQFTIRSLQIHIVTHLILLGNWRNANGWLSHEKSDTGMKQPQKNVRRQSIVNMMV